jgi:hypothetical protein
MARVSRRLFWLIAAWLLVFVGVTALHAQPSDEAAKIATATKEGKVVW